MKLDKHMAVMIVVVGIASSIGIGIKWIVPWLKDDNIVEEIAEKVIENKTGIDVDLSPTSPEQ